MTVTRHLHRQLFGGEFQWRPLHLGQPDSHERRKKKEKSEHRIGEITPLLVPPMKFLWPTVRFNEATNRSDSYSIQSMRRIAGCQ